MKIAILDKTKKKKVLSEVERFGITKVPELFIKTGKERIRAYSGNLSKEEIMDLWKILPIEGVGLYVAKERIDQHGVREVRLSVDGIHTWQDQITKNILDLSEEQEQEWFKGKTVALHGKQESGFVVVRSKLSGDFLGMGKISVDGEILYSYLPKERRRKSQTL